MLPRQTQRRKTHEIRLCWNVRDRGYLSFGEVPSNAQTGTLKNSIGMEFVKISAGEFMMGCSTGDNSCKADEKPQHQVRITKALEMGKYEVTQAQWKAVMNANESDFVGDNNPVENVTRAEAIAFANRLSMRNDGYKYRLPTEAEWEYAARAGTTGVTYGPLSDIAWYGKTPTMSPTRWAARNRMRGGFTTCSATSGNGPRIPGIRTYYATSPVDDPPGAPPNYGERGQPGFQGGAGVALPVIRGGGWPHPEEALRVTDRYHYFGPTLRLNDLGFRLVRQAVAQ